MSSRGVRVVVDYIDAVAVIDVAVAVIVISVVVAVERIAKHVGGEVRVIVIDAGIDDGDDDVAAASGDVPGAWPIDVRVGRATGLTEVINSLESESLQ